MNKKLLCIFLLLCLLLTACAGPAEPATEATAESTSPTEPDPLDLYLSAANELKNRSSLELDIRTEKSVRIGEDTYHESAIQTLTYQYAGTDKMLASNTEILSFDGYSILIQETYGAGNVYYTVDGSNFMGQMDGESFLDRFVPAVLADPTLYKTISTEETDDGCTYIFSDAVQAESWLVLENVELMEATATATINALGDLTQSTYRITYSYGGAEISQSFTASPDESPVAQIQLPKYPDEYTQLTFPDLPRLLEVTCGYVSQATQISSEITQSYISQAGGVYRGQSYNIDLSGKDDDLMVRSDCSITVIDLSRGSDTVTHTQTEHYQDKHYTLTENGKVTTQTSDLSPKDMRAFIINRLIENVALPQYLVDCEWVDLGSTYLFTFNCSEDMALLIQDMVSDTLFDDGSLLLSMADSYETTEMSGYLGIDKYTGLPTAVGYLYSGNHIVEEQPYALSYQVDQSFRLGSLSAKEHITGEAPSVPDGTPQPTPLFYHVTGSNGEEMWLLGTIHVGNSRTSNLPAPIYAALDASNALVVEFDIQTFEVQAKTDKELQTYLADSYFYTDGSTLADHIDSELYDYVIDLMKASGNYNQNIAMCKPFALESAISNFYLVQSNLLTPEDGVDRRLLSYAKSTGIQILDVESATFQLGLLSGYSDELQEVLLASTVAADPTKYWQSISELYEMWCAGDINGIRTALATDTSEMTQEELELYNEFNDAMTADRNKKMGEVALGYLESGETIFYAVGLAHLIEDGGLIQTLADAGYTVELVAYE